MCVHLQMKLLLKKSDAQMDASIKSYLEDVRDYEKMANQRQKKLDQMMSEMIKDEG